MVHVCISVILSVPVNYLGEVLYLLFIFLAYKYTLCYKQMFRFRASPR